MKTLILLVICLISSASFASDDIESLAASCSDCHGQKGIAPNPMWPNLAGQKSGYLAAQIRAFRDGDRSEPMMLPMVKDLTNEQIDSLATYYANMNVEPKNITTVNQAGKNVRAYCISCHGKQGVTVNEEWPNLASQQKGYLQKQLLDYREGKRTGLPMSVIANELTEQQIEAVAEYYSQLP